MARRAAPQVPRKRRRAERPARARLERVNENSHLRWVDEREESGEGLGLTDISARATTTDSIVLLLGIDDVTIDSRVEGRPADAPPRLSRRRNPAPERAAGLASASSPDARPAPTSRSRPPRTSLWRRAKTYDATPTKKSHRPRSRPTRRRDDATKTKLGTLSARARDGIARVHARGGVRVRVRVDERAAAAAAVDRRHRRGRGHRRVPHPRRDRRVSDDRAERDAVVRTESRKEHAGVVRPGRGARRRRPGAPVRPVPGP
eukprot:31111-Pelagococcus_subviridis.AAC.2